MKVNKPLAKQFVGILQCKNSDAKTRGKCENAWDSEQKILGRSKQTICDSVFRTQVPEKSAEHGGAFQPMSYPLQAGSSTTAAANKGRTTQDSF